MPRGGGKSNKRTNPQDASSHPSAPPSTRSKPSSSSSFSSPPSDPTRFNSQFGSSSSFVGSSLKASSSQNLNTLFSMSFSRQNRVLYDTELVKSFVAQFQPHKLRFSTLRDVFFAFWSAFVKENLQKNPPPVPKTVFWYDQGQWVSTIKRVNTSFQRDGWPSSQVVSFTNIKLPNDSYVYTSQYAASPVPRVNVTQEVGDFLQEVIEALQQQNVLEVRGLNSKISEAEYEKRIEMKYWEDRQRFDFYFWADDESSCLTIKFEYGSCEGFRLTGDDVARKAEFEAFVKTLEKVEQKKKADKEKECKKEVE